MMKSLYDYCRQVCISDKIPLSEKENIFAYCMDGCPDIRGENNEYDMACYVGLPSCHCCDYFFFEEDAISLVELTEIRITKKNMKSRYGKILGSKISDELSEEIISKLFQKLIADKNLLKMYGSMTVICQFSKKCKIMRNECDSRHYKINYWLVIYDGRKQDIKALDRIGKEIESRLNERLKGVGGKGKDGVKKDNFVNGVGVLLPDKLHEKINKCQEYNKHVTSNS